MRINGPLDASLWPAIAGMGDMGFSHAEWRYKQEDADGCCLTVLYAAREARITDEHDVEIHCHCRRAWHARDGWWQMATPRTRIRHDRRGVGLGRSATSAARANKRMEMRRRVEAQRK